MNVPADPPPAWTAPSRAYLLVVLALLAAMNHLDRHLLTILLEPIRAEFALSDVSGTAEVWFRVLEFPFTTGNYREVRCGRALGGDFRAEFSR